MTTITVRLNDAEISALDSLTLFKNQISRSATIRALIIGEITPPPLKPAGKKIITAQQQQRRRRRAPR